MKKISSAVNFLLLFIFISSMVPACSRTPADSAPIGEFIQGVWRGQSWHYLGTDLHNIDYRFEFIFPDILIFSSEPHGVFPNNITNVNNRIFHYRFISENHLVVVNSETFEIQLTLIGSQLALTSDLIENDVLFLERAPEFNWPLLALVLGLFVVALLGWLIRLIQVQNPFHRNSLSFLGSVFSKPGFFWRFIATISMILLFVLGIRIGANVWHTNQLQWIRLPWDAIITLELGILFAGLGLIAILPNRLMVWRIGNLMRSFWYLVGVFLVGFSFFGIFEAIFRLGVFLSTGSYSTF